MSDLSDQFSEIFRVQDILDTHIRTVMERGLSQGADDIRRPPALPVA